MRDRKQVGLTEFANSQVNDILEATPYFDTEASVYRFAVAVALALGVDVTKGQLEQDFATKWRTVKEDGDDSLPRLDTVDRRLARLISLHRPDWAQQPYRYSQALAVAGISYLHKQLVDLRDPLSVVVSGLNQHETNDG